MNWFSPWVHVNVLSHGTICVLFVVAFVFLFFFSSWHEVWWRQRGREGGEKRGCFTKQHLSASVWVLAATMFPDLREKAFADRAMTHRQYSLWPHSQWDIHIHTPRHTCTSKHTQKHHTDAQTHTEINIYTHIRGWWQPRWISSCCAATGQSRGFWFAVVFLSAAVFAVLPEHTAPGLGGHHSIHTYTASQLSSRGEERRSGVGEIWSDSFIWKKGMQ